MSPSRSKLGGPAAATFAARFTHGAEAGAASPSRAQFNAHSALLAPGPRFPQSGGSGGNGASSGRTAEGDSLDLAVERGLPSPDPFAATTYASYSSSTATAAAKPAHGLPSVASPQPFASNSSSTKFAPRASSLAKAGGAIFGAKLTAPPSGAPPAHAQGGTYQGRTFAPAPTHNNAPAAYSQATQPVTTASSTFGVGFGRHKFA
jgi:hypothetical protein